MPVDPNKVVSGGTVIKTKFGGSWADLAGVISVGGPEDQTGVVDSTELNPYAGGTTPNPIVLRKTFLPGWQDAGNAPMECHFSSQTYSQALAWKQVGTVALIRIDFRNGYSFVCSAFIESLGIGVAMGDETVKAPISFKLTGTPQFVTTDVAATM